MEHGGDLSAGRRALRVKQIARFSLYKTAADRPLHRRLCVIRDLVRVLERIQISLDGQNVALVVRVAVEDGCKLFAGDGIVDLFLVAKREQRSFGARCPSAALSDVRLWGHAMFSRMSAGHFLQRQRKVTICALVQSAPGLNVVSVVPLVMFSLTAHRTAPA